MTKLRNIGYLRFGSKIRQGFAGGITSITPRLSLSPLWISWAENEDAVGRGGVLYLGREPAAGGPAAQQGGGRHPPRISTQKIYFYLHIGPYRPLPGAGYRTVKSKTKNIFL